MTLSHSNLVEIFANPSAGFAREPYITLNLAGLPVNSGSGTVTVDFLDGVDATRSPGEGQIHAVAPFAYGIDGTLTAGAGGVATVTVTNRAGVSINGSGSSVSNVGANVFHFSTGANMINADQLNLYIGQVLTRTAGTTFDVSTAGNQAKFAVGNYYWRITFTGISLNYAGSYISAIDGVLSIQ